MNAAMTLFLILVGSFSVVMLLLIAVLVERIANSLQRIEGLLRAPGSKDSA